MGYMEVLLLLPDRPYQWKSRNYKFQIIHGIDIVGIRIRWIQISVFSLAFLPL